MASVRKESKPCSVCGLVFVGQPRQTICSPECRNVYCRDRYRDKKQLGVDRLRKGIDWLQKTIDKWFIPFVDKQPNGCWIWNGMMSRDQLYGQVTFHTNALRDPRVTALFPHVAGRKYGYVRAHRFSLALHLARPVPQDKVVCHKCDVPRCVNPDHLFVGTARDNIRDCVSKGRFRPGDSRGEKNPRAIVDEKQAIEIRLLSAEGVKTVELASRYGICRGQVRAIVRGQSWPMVPVDPSDLRAAGYKITATRQHGGLTIYTLEAK